MESSASIENSFRGEADELAATSSPRGRGAMSFVAALRKLVPRQPRVAPLLPAAPSRLLLPAAPSRLLATTVQQARERIFGWARPSKNFTPFKSLSNLKRKGLKGPSIVRYYPEPSPVAKSLVISRGFNEERIEKNILNRTMGRGPPKKGAGKRATRGKK